MYQPELKYIFNSGVIISHHLFLNLSWQGRKINYSCSTKERLFDTVMQCIICMVFFLNRHQWCFFSTGVNDFLNKGKNGRTLRSGKMYVAKPFVGCGAEEGEAIYSKVIKRAIKLFLKYHNQDILQTSLLLPLTFGATTSFILPKT